MGTTTTKKLIDDTQKQFYPETDVSSIVGLQAELNKKSDSPNRPYNQQQHTNGYQILVPYDPNDPKTMFAAQVAQENTVYEIRDVFNLRNSPVAHTANCTSTVTLDGKTFYYDDTLVVATSTNIVFSKEEHILYLNSSNTAYGSGVYFTDRQMHIASFEQDAVVTYYTADPLYLPANVTLKFTGGRLENGVLGVNNTLVLADSKDFIFDEVEVFGKSIGECYVDWFGAISSPSPVETDYHTEIETAFNSAFSIVKFNVGYYYVDETVHLNKQKVVDLNGKMTPGLKGFHSSSTNQSAYGGVLWTDQDIDVLVVGLGYPNGASYEVKPFVIKDGTIDCTRVGQEFSHSAIVVERCYMTDTVPHISTALIGPNVYYFTGTVNTNRYHCSGNGILFKDGMNTKSAPIFDGHIKSYIGRFLYGVKSEVSDVLTNLEFDCNIDNCVYAYDFGNYGNSGGRIAGSVQAGYWFGEKANGEPILKGSLYKLSIECRFWDINIAHTNGSKFTNEYVSLYNPNQIQTAPSYGPRAIGALQYHTKYDTPVKLTYGSVCQFPYMMREFTDFKEQFMPHLELLHNHYYGLPKMSEYDASTVGYYIDYQIEEDSTNYIVNSTCLFGENGTNESALRFKGQYESVAGKLSEAKAVVTINLYNRVRNFQGVGSLYIVLQTNNIYREGSAHTTWENVTVNVFNSSGSTLHHQEFVNNATSYPDDAKVFSVHVGNNNATKVEIIFENPTLRNNKFDIPVVLSMSAKTHVGYDHLFANGVNVPSNQTIGLAENRISMTGLHDGRYKLYTVIKNATEEQTLSGGMIASEIYSKTDLMREIAKDYAVGTVFKITNNTNTALVIKNSTTDFIEPQGHIVTTDDFLKTEGTSQQRPSLTNVWDGFKYYDTTLGINIYKNGSVWVNEDGTVMTNVTYVRGTTTNRDSMSSLGAANAGLKFYNTTSNRYELWNGSDWKNLDGSTLS